MSRRRSLSKLTASECTPDSGSGWGAHLIDFAVGLGLSATVLLIPTPVSFAWWNALSLAVSDLCLIALDARWGGSIGKLVVVVSMGNPQGTVRAPSPILSRR